ncbi:hypothetical protein [Vibrio harveyi]|uniref:hypothetical protein n=1 Tax=Vibrio harveyi TaxID=669 RepID=UPI00238012EB|nr:hypothetical protein [Vibrio harveyi]
MKIQPETKKTLKLGYSLLLILPLLAINSINIVKGTEEKSHEYYIDKAVEDFVNSAKADTTMTDAEIAIHAEQFRNHIAKQYD